MRPFIHLSSHIRILFSNARVTAYESHVHKLVVVHFHGWHSINCINYRKCVLCVSSVSGPDDSLVSYNICHRWWHATWPKPIQSHKICIYFNFSIYGKMISNLTYFPLFSHLAFTRIPKTNKKKIAVLCIECEENNFTAFILWLRWGWWWWSKKLEHRVHRAWTAYHR